MLITAYDSGEFTGWAQALNGTVIGCGLVHVYRDRPMGRLPDSRGGLVVIEKPNHRRHGKTVDPNDLITLGIKVGRLVETYLVLGSQVRVILPTDWKGGTPKLIQNARDEKTLTVEEARTVAYFMAAVAESYRNNVWDALGIVQWAARREKERS